MQSQADITRPHRSTEQHLCVLSLCPSSCHNPPICLLLIHPPLLVAGSGLPSRAMQEGFI